MQDYAAALRAEILREVPPLRARWGDVTTVYIGGGTPTVLPAECLTEILRTLIDAAGIPQECTVEANPGTVDVHSLAQLRAAGANRLSLGVQSFDDADLRRLPRHRTHPHGRGGTRGISRGACGGVRQHQSRPYVWTADTNT